ncbi:hypothetical protein HDU76_005273, partial [Blyttiomyces sp. JEL0837]
PAPPPQQTTAQPPPQQTTDNTPQQQQNTDSTSNTGIQTSTSSNVNASPTLVGGGTGSNTNNGQGSGGSGTLNSPPSSESSAAAATTASSSSSIPIVSIAAGIGGVVLIAILVIGFFVYRKRQKDNVKKQNQAYKAGINAINGNAVEVKGIAGGANGGMPVVVSANVAGSGASVHSWEQKTSPVVGNQSFGMQNQQYQPYGMQQGQQQMCNNTAPQSQQYHQPQQQQQSWSSNTATPTRTPTKLRPQFQDDQSPAWMAPPQQYHQQQYHQQQSNSNASYSPEPVAPPRRTVAPPTPMQNDYKPAYNGNGNVGESLGNEKKSGFAPAGEFDDGYPRDVKAQYQGNNYGNNNPRESYGQAPPSYDKH